jgi:hypothetical protein
VSAGARILVLGSELSLLSLKLASALPDVTMLVLHATAAAAERHRSLAEVMHVVIKALLRLY